MDLIQIIQIIIFILFSTFFVIISYKSLRNSRSHGFYRFFIFELTLIVILVNLRYWFTEPFSFQQIISWLSLIISIYMIISSVYLLHKYGGFRERRTNSADFKFESTAKIVTRGIYKYIRHPMYSSILFLALGAILKQITLLTLVILFIIFFLLIIIAKVEEKENVLNLGKEYEDYINKTKMYIPFII